MGMGGKKRGQKPPPSYSNKEDEDDDLSSSSCSCDEEESFKCPHVGKGVQHNAIKKSTKPSFTSIGVCSVCKKEKTNKNGIKPSMVTPSKDIWLCLRCGTQLCTDKKHLKDHFDTPRSEIHCIAMNISDTESWTIHCQICNRTLSHDSSKKLREAVECVKKIKMEKEASKTKNKAATTTMMTTIATGGSVVAQSNHPSQVQLPKVRGLSNLGNTCFFNSVMQCLSQSHPLIHILDLHCRKGATFTTPELRTENGEEVEALTLKLPDSGPLTMSLAAFLKEMNSLGKSGVYNPSHLFGQICSKSPQFRGYHQEDAHELLRHLMEGLKTEEVQRQKTCILKNFGLSDKSSRASVDPSIRRKLQSLNRHSNHTIVDRLFGGLLVSTILCEQCHNSSQIYEPFLDISLPLVEEKVPRLKEDEKSSVSCFGETKSKHQLRKEKGKLRKEKRKNKANNISEKENVSNSQTIINGYASEEEKEKVSEEKEVEKKEETADEEKKEETAEEEKKEETADEEKKEEEIEEEEKKEKKPKEEKKEEKKEFSEQNNKSGPKDGDEEDEEDGDYSDGDDWEWWKDDDENEIEENDNKNGNNENDIDSTTASTTTSTSKPLVSLNPISQQVLGEVSRGESSERDKTPDKKDENTGASSNADVEDNLEQPRSPFHPDSEHLDPRMSQLSRKVCRLAISTADLEETFPQREYADGDQEDKEESKRRIRNDWIARSLTSIAPKYSSRTPGECSIYSCLAQFTSPELLTGNNKWACEKCTKMQHNQSDSDSDEKTVYSNASKQLLIFLPPAILTIHLKRFQQTMCSLKKLNKHVSFPLILDMAPFCSSTSVCTPTVDAGTKSIKYYLFGLVEHSGRLHGGHYTAYVKVRPSNYECDFSRFYSSPRVNNDEVDELLHEIERKYRNLALKNKESSQQNEEEMKDEAHPPEPHRWFHISDSSVMEVSEERVLKTQAYILFYERFQ